MESYEKLEKYKLICDLKYTILYTFTHTLANVF